MAHFAASFFSRSGLNLEVNSLTLDFTSLLSNEGNKWVPRAEKEIDSHSFFWQLYHAEYNQILCKQVWIIRDASENSESYNLGENYTAYM